MNRIMQLKELIKQESYAVKLFVILLLTIVAATDLIIATSLSDEIGMGMMIPYIFLYLLIPLIVIFRKKVSPRIIKYTIFFTYISASLINELILFWGSIDYKGGNVAEVFFVLFSPIFINKRYFWTVISVIFIKYFLVGVMLQSLFVMFPIAFLLVFALVAFIILNRFTGYIVAMDVSYLRQFEGVVKGIVSTLELKDPYTRGHSERVAEYAVILADTLEIYNTNELKLISYACLLHDVGKVHTPDYILTKPSKLSEEEYALVKKHPIVGANAIKDIEGMELCLDIVLYHHERWDGKGYPEGLKEKQIPLTARIAAIADAFDAMTSHRSYRGAMSAEEAYNQIIQARGIQFDPNLVDQFQVIYPTWASILAAKAESSEFLITGTEGR